MALYGLKIRRPYIGNIYQAGEGQLYGYTGLQDFTNPATGNQESMRFTLDSAAMFRYYFTCDWATLMAAAEGCGFNITVDGTIVIQWSAVPAGGVPVGAGIAQGKMFVPANSEVVTYILNPSAGAGTAAAAGLFLEGQILATTSAGLQVGDETIPPGLRDIPAARKRAPAFSSDLLGAITEGSF